MFFAFSKMVCYNRKTDGCNKQYEKNHHPRAPNQCILFLPQDNPHTSGSYRSPRRVGPGVFSITGDGTVLFHSRIHPCCGGRGVQYSLTWINYEHICDLICLLPKWKRSHRFILCEKRTGFLCLTVMLFGHPTQCQESGYCSSGSICLYHHSLSKNQKARLDNS
jgi:hypothetical protein